MPQWLAGLLVIVFSFSCAIPVYAKGGDIVWQSGDAQRGKQEARASAVDSSGNVIIAGYRNLLASTDDDYCTVKFNSDGTVAWRAFHKHNESGGSDQVTALVIDGNDDIIVTGYVWNGFNNDVHTIKYNGTNGAVIWQHTFNGAANGNDVATSIAIDKVNDIIYVGGYSQNTAGNDDYVILKYANGATGPGNDPSTVITYNGPANGIDRVTSIATGPDGVAVTGNSWNGHDFDYLTIKYDFNNVKLWEWRYLAPGNRDDTGRYVKIDSAGNVIVTGTATNALDYDIYTAKYCGSNTPVLCGNKNAGELIWEKTYNNAFDDEPTALYVDAAGNVYITGYTWTLAGNNDIYTAKYNGATGALLWDKIFDSGDGNTDVATATGIIVDESGEVYVTGYTATAGNYDFRTIKYNKQNGNQLWQRSFNGVANKSDRTVGIGTSPVDKRVYVAGWSDKTTPLDAGTDTNTMPPLDGGEAAATNGSSTTVENTAKNWVVNRWSGHIVKMTSGLNNGASRYILSNSGNTLTVVVAFDNTVAAGDTYEISGSKTSIEDATKTWVVDQWKDYHVMLTSGVNAGIFRKIMSNSGTSLTFDVDLGDAVSAGDTYYIFDKDDYDYYLIKYDQGVINPPTGLTAEALSKDTNNLYQVGLSWTDNSPNEEGFKIERKLGTGEWTEIGSVGANVTTYIDTTGLPENNYYSYRVRAYNAATISDPDYSNEAHVLTLLVDYVAPSWAYTFDSSYGLEDYATAIAVGPDDNPVVTGKSDSGLVGMFDYYTVKLNRLNGGVLWADRYDSMQNEMDIPTCVAVDGNNNALVSGYSSLFYAPVQGNIHSVFTMKYPSAGPPVAWEKQYNGPGGIDDRSMAVASTTDGSSVVVIGYGKNATPEPNGPNEDIYVVKYLANGDLAWAAAPYDGGRNDIPTAVGFAPDGSIYVSGYRQNASGLLSDRSNYDLFVAKYHGQTGAVIWSDFYNGPGNGDDRALALAVDAAGDLYVTGYETNAAGNKDFVTIKYNGAGATAQRIWTRTFDGPAYGDDQAVAVKVDPIDSNIVVAGTSLTSPGDNDFHVIRYNPAGDVVWQKTHPRHANDDYVTAMGMDNSGNIYVAGNTSNGLTTDSITIKYDYEGIVVGETIYNGAADSFDESASVVANTRGEAFIAGYTTNAAGNTDYLVYKVAGDPLPAPYPFNRAPLYTTVTLTWADKSTVEDGFILERKDGTCSSSNAWSTIATLPTDTTSYTDTGRTPGAQYCYQIHSYKGTVPSRLVQGVVTMLIPPAPGNFTAVPGDTTTVNLAWTDTTTGETGFTIERCIGATCVSFTAPANATTYKDGTACNATTYSYRITANGADWASPLAVASATTPNQVAPTGLAAQRVSESQIRLTWTSHTTDESGFEVWRCRDGAGNSPCTDYAKLGFSADPGATTYNDHGLTPDSIYRYQIRAYKTMPSCSWTSDLSNSTYAETTSNAPVLIATPISDNTSQINLSWTDTTKTETGFRLERCISEPCTADTDFTVVTTTSPNVMNYSDTGVCQNSQYKYRIKALNEGPSFSGTGAWTRRLPLTIENFQPDFLVRVSVNYLAGMKGDFSDLRFYDERAHSELAYWIESKTDSSKATVWIKTGQYKNVYMYYGNASATNASNMTSIFGSGLMGYWPFNEAAGTISGTSADLSGKGNNVTLYSFAAPFGVVSSGVYGNALSLDGINDNARNNTVNLPTGSVATVEAWIYPKGYAEVSYNGIVSWSNRQCNGLGIALSIQNSGRPSMPTWCNDYVPATGAAATLNSWNHIAAVLDGKSATLYMNGQSLGTTTLTYLPNLSSINLAIGALDYVGRYFNGLIDEVRIYNRALAPEEIASRYAPVLPVATVGTTPELPDPAPSFTFFTWDGPYSSPLVMATTPMLATPINPAANRVSEEQIDVTWQYTTADQTGFRIDRCADSDCATVQQTFEKGAADRSFSDTGLAYNTTYYYRIRAYKTATCSGESLNTAIVSAMTTLQAPVVIPPLSTANTTTCNDIRFTDSDGVTPLNYWVESGCNSAATKVWLKFSSLPAGEKTIYLYYGNPPAAPAATDPTSIFDFFDDFSGTTINAAKWKEYDQPANYITQNDELVVSGGNGGWNYTGMKSVPSFTRPFILEFNHYRTGGSYAMFGLATTTYDRPYYGDLVYGIYPVYDGNGNRLNVHESGTQMADNLKPILSGTWQYYKIAVLSTGAKYYHGDSNSSYTLFYDSMYSNTSPLKIDFDVNSQAFKLDNVKIRRYASQEPAFSLLPEQTGNFLTDGKWLVSRAIVVSNTTGGSLANYQLAVVTDTTSLATDQITLTWTDRTATETGYNIERCLGTAAECNNTAFAIEKTFSTAAVVGIGSTASFADREVSKNTGYCYRVKAVKNTSWLETDPSEVVCAQTLPVPDPPVLTATPYETKIDLSWTDTTTGENGFILDRCTVQAPATDCDLSLPDAGFPKNFGPNVTSFSDASVCSSSYKYRVKSYKTGAPVWPGYSTEVTTATILPAVPTGLTAVKGSEIRINLSWTDNTGDETGFEIWRCEGSTCDFTVKTVLFAGPVPGTGTVQTYSDTTGLEPNKTYRYQVRAYKTGGTCGWPSGFSTTAAETTSTSAPTGLSGTAPNTTQVNLAWTDTTASETGFMIQRCDGPACNFTTPDTRTFSAGPNAITYGDREACAGLIYSYQLKAVNNGLAFDGGGCWTRRAPLTITNFQPDFETRLTITKAADMQADFDDIRFVDATANKELPYWLESKTDGISATFWVKTGANNNIYLYYGNASAQSASSAANTFTFYDDFDGTGIDTTKWTITDGTGFSVSNGYLHGTNTTGRLTSKATFSAGVIQEVKAKATSLAPNGQMMAGFYLASNNNFGVLDHPGSAYYANNGAWTPNNVQIPVNNMLYTLTVKGPSTVNQQIYNLDTASMFWNPVDIANAVSEEPVVLGRRYDSDGYNGQAYAVDWDWVRVRKYAATEPIATIGSEQQDNACFPFTGKFDGQYSQAAVVVTPKIGNILADSDFENTTTNWTGAAGTLTGTSFDTTTSYSGKTSLKLSATGASLGRQQVIAVQPGTNYSLSGYLKASLTAGKAQCDVQGTGIDSAGIAIAFGSANNNAGWVDLTETVTIPAGTTSVNIRCFADGSPRGTAWFDMVQFVPVPVIKLSATRDSEAQVNLSWTENIADESGFQVERCSLTTCGETDFIQVGNDLPANTVSFMDVVPSPDITYTYRIKSFKTSSCGWVTTSNMASVTTSFTSPSNLTATPVNTTRVDLSWTYKTATESGFRIERCEGATCTNFSEIDKAPPGATSYSDSSVCNGKDYRYQVKAFKDGLSSTGSGCWTRKKALTIANFMPATQMRLTITYEANMKSDFSDIRFYDETAKIELPYWIERKIDGASATVWLKTGASNVIYLYYGNPSATNVSSGSRTFEFFDDFSGTAINTGKWIEADTTTNYITQNNELVVNGGTGSWNTGMYSVPSFARPFIFEVDVMNTTTGYAIFGAKDGGTGISYSDFVYGTYLYYYADAYLYVYEDGVSRGDTGQRPPANTWKYFRLEAMRSGAKYYFGDSVSSYAQYYSSAYSAETPLRVGFSNQNRAFKLDTARVRRYVAVEPTVSDVGSEEYLPGCFSFNDTWPVAPVSNIAGVTTPAWVNPSGLTATAVTDTQIDLAWSDTTTDESGFKLEMCSNGLCASDQDFTQIGLTGADVTNYSIYNLDPSKSYCFRVRTYKTVACGWNTDYSNTACDLTISARPTNLTALALNSFKIRLNWVDNASDEDGFEIEAQVWNGRWAHIATVGQNVTTFTDTNGIEPLKTYNYRMRSYRGLDKSPYYYLATPVTTPPYTPGDSTCP